MLSARARHSPTRCGGMSFVTCRSKKSSGSESGESCSSCTCNEQRWACTVRSGMPAPVFIDWTTREDVPQGDVALVYHVEHLISSTHASAGVAVARSLTWFCKGANVGLPVLGCLQPSGSVVDTKHSAHVTQPRFPRPLAHRLLPGSFCCCLGLAVSLLSFSTAEPCPPGRPGAIGGRLDLL